MKTRLKRIWKSLIDIPDIEVGMAILATGLIAVIVVIVGLLLGFFQ